MPTVTLESKPSIYFSPNHADKSWRLTEKVIAVIETILQNLDNTYTFSSVKVPNSVGDLTEVDIAFSHLPNPTAAFRFVQVRDRSNVQGRPWIEQIIGQQHVLGISEAIAVSTNRFTQEAIRLAFNQGIQVRLLHNETERQIKKWFAPDYISGNSPLAEIEECSVWVKMGERIQEFKADRLKASQPNILIPTEVPHKFKVISLTRVFNTDILRNHDYRAQLLSQIPKDNGSHRATTICQYDEPRLFIQAEDLPTNVNEGKGGVFPIVAIVFCFVIRQRQFRATVDYRYKYLDAINDEVLAEVVIAGFEMENQYYISLVRHSCDEANCMIGGAFFH